MSGVLVIAEVRGGALRPVSLELIGAGRMLSEQGAGELSVALIASDAEAHVKELKLAGVDEVLAVPSPLAHFEAHVAQAVLEALIERTSPAVVLAGHTVDSLGFLAAVAARGGHGFASDVTELSWGERGLGAVRSAYGERLVRELDFPGRDTVLLQLRPGAFAAAVAGLGAEKASSERLDLDLEGCARSERIELRDPPASGEDIAKADFVLALGRGVGARERVAELERLAARIGATLAVSGPLVEAGWAPRARKVGQSGKTVAPRVYLALGISGAAQHLAGMSSSRTIIAVNSDPDARIFDVAHYGAVADLFEVAAALERELA
ncbi:MAG: electron transfer flavoprotein subunit alpha/FixB family protein [Solirubrobacterales bacterium]|nr:electron transfer flavoprotein subunit alpha/FixB family protein [Solirubrobacterales bacterium]